MYAQNIAHDLTDFENQINKESNAANSKLKTFEFAVTDFDSLAFSEEELKNIYSNHYHQDKQRFINENSSYSQFFRESLHQHKKGEENSDLDLSQLKQSINTMANEVFNDKIENVRVSDLLHNRHSDFPEKINLIAKLKNLTHNSTPLLRTQRLSNEMPYTQKVLVGEIQNELRPKLEDLLNSEQLHNLEVNNQYIIGSFSHKYNFSISMVDDLKKQLTSKNQKYSEQKEFYLSEEHFNHLIHGDEVTNDVENNVNIELDEDLIIALSFNIIDSDKKSNTFVDELNIPCGSNIEELKKIWETKKMRDNHKRASIKRAEIEGSEKLCIEFRNQLLKLIEKFSFNQHDIESIKNVYLSYGGQIENWNQ